MSLHIVTCAQCKARLSEVEDAEARGFRASELFRVANPSPPHWHDAGHQCFYSTTGVVTLCSAQRQQPPTYFNPRPLAQEGGSL